MSIYAEIRDSSRTAGFSAFHEADFTCFYKFVIPVLQVSDGMYNVV